jgi:hypothetical protein
LPYASEKGQSVIYFNANPTRRSGCKTIFDWRRADADEPRYPADDRFETYSVGILRDDQDRCSLGKIGGAAAR